MSLRQPHTDGCTDTEPQTDIDQFELPATTPELIRWLDEKPNFVEIEREKRVRVSKELRTLMSHDPTDRPRITEARNNRITRVTTELLFVHPDYELTGRACYDSQAEVCAAWEDMQFPAHNRTRVERIHGAELYSWSSTSAPRRRFAFRGETRNSDPTINYHAVQHPAGHGAIQHYDAIAAVRTKSGLVLVNEQDFATGFAKMTRPDEYDNELPLTGIRSVISTAPETLYDIERVTADKTDTTYTTTSDPIGGHDVVTGVRKHWSNDRQTMLVEFSTGAKVVLLWDSTAKDAAERKAGFYLPPEEAAIIQTASDALDLLQPIDVLQARERNLDVIPADEYAGDDLSFHGPALGDAIIRQGEWYLIPMPEDFDPKAPIFKPLPVPNRQSSWDVSLIEDELPDVLDIADVDGHADTLPTECPDCGAGGLEVNARQPIATCPDCGTATVYDEDTFDDILVDAQDEYVRNTYAERYREARKTLDSHVPRDLAVTEDGIYVRGTFRHVPSSSFDDPDHQMINLRDRWHLAAENTRDVTVFNLEPQRDHQGVARVE